MTVWDCFMYSGESAALEIRLHELDDVVDNFIIVEGSRTFRGVRKPFYLDRVWGDLKPWHDRIHRVKVEHWPQTQDPWVMEHFQRDQITRGLVEVEAAQDDLVIVSDADEIPRASAVRSVNVWGGVVHLDFDTYYFCLDWRVPDRWNQGGRPFVVLREQMGSPQEMRDNVKRIALNGGWHFSYLGTPREVQGKIQSFAHAEYDTPEYRSLNHLELCAQHGLDPFWRFELEPVEVDTTYPQWIQENLDTLGHLTRPK